MILRGRSSNCGAGFAALFSLLAMAFPAAADPAAAVGEGWRVIFDIENDVIAAEDKHYTNGLFLSLLAPRGNLPSWIRSAAVLLPPYSVDQRIEGSADQSDESSEIRWGVALGHEMYTPENSFATQVVENDRPYAGYLYLRFGLYRDRDRERVGKIPFLDTLEVDLGVVGPAALARQGQKLIHDISRSPRFRGWDNQLKNEFGLILRRSRHWRVPGKAIELGKALRVDAIANLTAELGNVKTAGTLGILLRSGWRLPADFGRGRFSPPDEGKQGFRFFVFAGAEVTGVVRDIFLDGNTFRDSHHVAKRAVVVQLPFGLAYERGRFRTSLSLHWNSEAFKGQNGADLYGRWSIGIDY